MAFTHQVSETIITGDGTKNTTQSISVNSEIAVDIPVTHGTTNVQHKIAFPTTGGLLKTLYLVCDQTVTVYTNHASGASPDNTIALTAGVPVMWNVNSVYASPVAAADVASIYVTHGGGTDAVALSIRAGWNP